LEGGLRLGEKILAPPYSQHPVFASPLSAFFIGHALLQKMDFLNKRHVMSWKNFPLEAGSWLKFNPVITY